MVISACGKRRRGDGSNHSMTWRRLARGELSWETLRCRSRILEWTRAFFRERGFLEVDPPIAQPYPNIDPNVFPVQVSDAAGRTSGLYLGKVFRNREGSPLHHPEFTMLEWYRVAEPAAAVMKDVEDLLRHLARRTTGAEEIRHGGERNSL